MLINVSALLDQTEDGGHLIAVFAYLSADAFGQHSGDIFIETAAGHMAAASDLYARLTDTSESAHVDLGGTNERIAQCLSEFRYELLQVFFIDFKYLADKGESV